MLTKCDHCGELAVDEDDQVCKSCGIVIDDIKFGEEFCPPRRIPYTPVRRWNLKSYKATRPSIALTYGLDSLKNLCHVFKIPNERRNEVTEILTGAYKAKKFKLKEDVGVVAGCCLLLLQRKYNQIIPLSEICARLQCTRKKFSYYLKFVKSWLSSNNQTAHVTPHNEDNAIFGQSHKKAERTDPDLPEVAEPLISLVCEKACKEEKSRLIKKTTELVKLAHSCWLFTGRSPRSVVVACAFLCWKSINPQRRRASFLQFCTELTVDEPIARLRIPELKALLLKLGRMIPSYSKDYVNENNVLFHLDTILENSETLRNDLLTDEVSEEAVNCKEYSTFRFPINKVPRKIDKSAVQYDSDMNASDIEISDTEIESYIRNDEEKKAASNLHDTKVFKCPHK